MRRSLLLLSAALLVAAGSLAWAGDDSDYDRDTEDRPAQVSPDQSSDEDKAPSQPGSTSPAKPASPSNARPSSPSANRPASPRTEPSNDEDDDYRPTVRSSQVQAGRDQTATSADDDDEIDVERGTRQPRQENPGQPPRLGRGNNNGRRPPSSPNPPNNSYQPRPRSRGGHHYNGPRDYAHRPRERWRHDRYNHYGHWRFLWFWGPVVYAPPVVVYPRVRAPRSGIAVYVRHTGDDDVGRDFAREVRGQLRDVGLRQVYSPAEARLELFIVSMDENPEDPGYGSAVSVSYIWNPGHRFITAQMLDVGGYEIPELAELVVDYSAELIDDYR